MLDVLWMTLQKQRFVENEQAFREINEQTSRGGEWRVSGRAAPLGGLRVLERRVP
jgi:hypothetical protein